MTTFKHGDGCHACGEILTRDIFLTRYGAVLCPSCAERYDGKPPLDNRPSMWYTFLARILGLFTNRKRKRQTDGKGNEE